MKEAEWIQKALSSDISDSVIVLNTGHTNNLKESYDLSEKYLDSDEVNSNIWEAAIVFKLVKTLLKVMFNVIVCKLFYFHIRYWNKCF